MLYHERKRPGAGHPAKNGCCVPEGCGIMSVRKAAGAKVLADILRGRAALCPLSPEDVSERLERRGIHMTADDVSDVFRGRAVPSIDIFAALSETVGLR